MCPFDRKWWGDPASEWQSWAPSPMVTGSHPELRPSGFWDVNPNPSLPTPMESLSWLTRLLTRCLWATGKALREHELHVSIALCSLKKKKRQSLGDAEKAKEVRLPWAGSGPSRQSSWAPRCDSWKSPSHQGPHRSQTFYPMIFLSVQDELRVKRCCLLSHTQKRRLCKGQV